MYDGSNPQLKLAFDFVQYTGDHIYLTGKAGTGKTTFLKNLKKQSTKRMIVVAPTGVAAINAGGVTIHSFFQMPFGPMIPTQYFENLPTNQNPQRVKKFSKEKRDIIRGLDLLVIDEISMVRADLLDGIDDVLRRYKNRNVPFGGVQLLMIGDIQQLAPVVKDEDWQILKDFYSGMFFFNSRALQQTNFVTIELKHIYRQTNLDFIEILNKVRDNDLDDQDIETLNTRYIRNFEPEDQDGYITLTTHNRNAKHINELKLEKIEAENFCFEAKIDGDFPEYSYPTDFELNLKIGAQVMFVRNDASPERLYYNGKIGYISEIEEHLVMVRCPDGEAVVVQPVDWENITYELNQETKEIKENVIGKFTQYPLKLAWAITIHKSQGLTFEKVIIDARAAFAHGQVYVALSRCKTMEGIVLSSPIGANAVKSDSTVNRFVKEYENDQPDQEKLSVATCNFQKRLLLELIDFSGILRNLLHLRKIVSDHQSVVSPGATNELNIVIETTNTKLIAVAEKFKNQILGLLHANPNAEDNPELQERIKKGAIYFIDMIENHVYSKIDELTLDTDNLAVRSDIKKIADRLKGETLKCKVYLKSVVNGFQLQRYLNERVKDLLDIEKVQKKKSKASDRKKVQCDHPELLERLKHYRTQKATEEKIGAYMIFHQNTLYELANQRPQSKGALQKIKGIGKGKIKKYGDELVQIISDYIDEEKFIAQNG